MEKAIKEKIDLLFDYDKQKVFQMLEEYVPASNWCEFIKENNNGNEFIFDDFKFITLKQDIERYIEELEKRIFAYEKCFKSKEITSFKNEYFFLSNFFSCQINFDGLTYCCVESAFQAQKSTDLETKKKFCNLAPKDAKALGRKIELRSDWETVKVDIMKQLILKKFGDSLLKQKLIQTYPFSLIEGNNWNDTFWGVCNGVGKNVLGTLLTEIRHEFVVNKIMENERK